MAVWSASRTSGRPARTLQDGLAPTVGSGISQTFDSGVLRRKTVQEGEGKRDDQLMSTVPEAVRLEPARRVQNPKIGTQTPQETEARGTRLSAQRVRAKHARKAETVADDLTRFLGHSLKRQRFWELDGLIEEIAGGAGVTPLECLKAAVFYFANKGGSDHVENPQGLDFRFFTYEEEKMLSDAGHGDVVNNAENLSDEQRTIAEETVIDIAVEGLLEDSYEAAAYLDRE
jgi:hypothetical protein